MSKFVCTEFFNLNTAVNKNVRQQVPEAAMDAFFEEWLLSVHGILGKKSQGRNEPRFHQKFKFDFEH